MSSCPPHSHSLYTHTLSRHICPWRTHFLPPLCHLSPPFISSALRKYLLSFLNFLSALSWKRITPLAHTLNFLCSAVGRDKLLVLKLAPNSGLFITRPDTHTINLFGCPGKKKKTPLLLLILVCPILLSVSTANGILRFKNDSVAMDHYACHISDSDTNYSLTFQSNHFVYFFPHPKSKPLQEAV